MVSLLSGALLKRAVFPGLSTSRSDRGGVSLLVSSRCVGLLSRLKRSVNGHLACGKEIPTLVTGF